ncbi:hypothetical protein L0Y34_01530 [Candidatus Parcubacteria bacterium]|nr:hypothetical protein [Candidatus Parcubacteria bacterium]
MTAASLLYFFALALWSAFVAYQLMKLFTKNTSPPPPSPADESAAQKPPTLSTHVGFKSFARGRELTVEDIVKSLSKEN